MPWKGEKNPYLIWLSEIILQQTRVEQGLPYYLKFKKHFPDVKKLALASENEILKMWQGLGYNTRARNLHAAAKYIQQNFRGKFPRSYEEIRRLKGVGDYTAAAVASFAFNLPHAVVDANVFRVLARYYGITTPVDTAKGKRQFKTLAEKLISPDFPAKYNQAIMDFGAVQCVPKNPGCQKCPLRNGCAARKKNLVEKLPVKTKKIRQRQRFFHYFILLDGNFTYIKKREGKDIWRGMFEFPVMESEKKLPLEKLADSASFRQLFPRISLRKISLAGEFRQTLSHQKIFASFYLVQMPVRFDIRNLKKVHRRNLKEHAFPGIIRMFLADDNNHRI